MNIPIVNADMIDDYTAQRYHVFGFPLGNFGIYLAVASLAGLDDMQSALNELADALPEYAPGLMGDPDYIAELQADAVRDGRDIDEYVDEVYICAGNASDYIDMPSCYHYVNYADLLKMQEGIY